MSIVKRVKFLTLGMEKQGVDMYVCIYRGVPIESTSWHPLTGSQTCSL